MRYLFGAFGHTVLSAEDGRQGLDAARNEHPDLIICDVQLPEMDGFEVARWLKSDPELRKTPLVAVTALAMVGDRDRMLAAGFDGYLAKPIDPETFVRQMENFLKDGSEGDRETRRPGDPEKGPTSSLSPCLGVSSSSVQGPTILVVDNLPVNLELARGILEPFGYHVVTAGGMTEGLAMARQIDCDLILSDVCMPEGTGYDFIQVIKADPLLCTIPFVFITSTMLDEKDRVKGLALGATKFLCRPIEPEAFLAEIEACLHEKGRS
jgi:two-component system cell cycle response regulator